ncbi:MAG: alpha/beta hydrolase [Ferruginibacter sp.]
MTPICKSLSLNGANISYRISGTGPFLVLIHGFAEDSRIWDNLVTELEKVHTLLIPDLPGSGKSGMIPGSPSIADFADCIHGIFVKEQIDSAILIGHSMGGYIALAFAAKYGDKLFALGLFHSSAFADDEAKIATRRKAISVMKEKGAMVFLKTAIPGLFYDKEKSHADIEDLVEKGSQFTAEALIQYYEAMINRPDTTDTLRNLPIPLLLILGKHDPAVPLDQGLKQTHLAAETHLHILKKSAHMGMLEEKVTAIEILLKFLHLLRHNLN